MSNEKTSQASTMDRYKTRELAGIPQRVKLMDPATSKLTDDWLDIRSSLSDEFIEARDLGMRNAAAIGAIKDEKERLKASREGSLRLKAALVAGWSFPEPLTEASVMDFLREAPQLQDLVINVADDTAAFFTKPSSNSSDGPKKK